MYRLRMKLNDQKPNMERLKRLQRSLEKTTPEEIINALCSVALGRVKAETPRGRTGKIRSGWEKAVHRVGNQFEGLVYNVAESDPKGNVILNVLEKGSSYKQKRIYPKTAKVLAFFWERYDMMIFARSVLAVDKKAFHMVQNTKRFMRTVYKDIAKVILAKRVKEAMT